MGSPTSSAESDDPIVIGEAPKCDQNKYSLVNIKFSLNQFYGRFQRTIQHSELRRSTCNVSCVDVKFKSLN
jgi:hypothetical protein